jgi:hypothetical protein
MKFVVVQGNCLGAIVFLSGCATLRPEDEVLSKSDIARLSCACPKWRIAAVHHRGHFDGNAGASACILSAMHLNESDNKVQEPRLWSSDGWTARVVKNEDDDGWAVAMTADGAAEPALVGPWTMGRDKKNPKPLDQSAFLTLVKTAREFVRRSEQQLHASLHQSIEVGAAQGRVTVFLDIEPDEDNPSAMLSARDEGGDLLAQVRVSPGFKLNRASAVAWVEGGYAKP